MVNKTVNKFDRFTKKGPTNTSENVPYAFSHIAAGAPPSVYMSMATGNTFDEAMQETNNIPMPEDDMELDIDLALDPELDDPDAIEKAIYQLRIAEEKEIEPEEVLETPYGPGLSAEEIDLLLDAYPALDAGVDLDMIDENFDEVDRMLGKSGDSIEAAMDAAEQRAEDEGDIGASPAMMRQLGDNLGGSLEAMLNPRNRGEEMAAERFTNSPFDPYEALRSASDESIRVLQEADDNQNIEQAEGPSRWMGIGLDTDLDTMVGGASDRVLFGYNQEPNNNQSQDSGKFDYLFEIILTPNDDDGNYLSPDAVIAYLEELGISPEAISEFLATSQTGSSKYGSIGDEYLKKLREYAEPIDSGLNPDREEPPGFVEEEDEAIFKAGGTEPPPKIAATTLVGENLTKVFYTTIYGYPESGRSDVRDRLPYIFNDTRTLFFLHEGFGLYETVKRINDLGDAGTEEEINDLIQPMEESYKSFLAEYLKDPRSKRTGQDFRDKVGLIAGTLTYGAEHPKKEGDEEKGEEAWSDEFERRYMWVDAIFGEGSTGQTTSTWAQTNRRNLIKMAATQGGQGWYSSLIHASVDRVMDYYKNIGWTAEEIFARMARLTGSPSTEPLAKNPVVVLADKILAVEKTGDLYPEQVPKESFSEPWGMFDMPGEEIPGEEIPGEEILGEVSGPPPIPGWTTPDGKPLDQLGPQSGWSQPGPLPYKLTPSTPSYDDLPPYGEWSGADQSDFLGDQSWQAPGRFEGVPSGMTMGSLMPTPEEQDDIDRILSAREQADAYRVGFIPGEFPDIEETMDAQTGTFTFQDYLEREAAKKRIYDQRRQPVRATPPFWVTNRNRPSL